MISLRVFLCAVSTNCRDHLGVGSLSTPIETTYCFFVEICIGCENSNVFSMFRSLSVLNRAAVFSLYSGDSILSIFRSFSLLNRPVRISRNRKPIVFIQPKAAIFSRNNFYYYYFIVDRLKSIYNIYDLRI